MKGLDMGAHTGPMNLFVADSAEAAADSAARDLADSIRAAVDARGRCTLAFSGGHSPRILFRALAQQRVPWGSVHVFQVDERVVSIGSPDRNWTELQRNLFDHITIPASNLHPMPVDSPDLGKAAEQYTADLTAVAGQPPVLDVIHLGLGSDGHTASLIPGDPVLHEVETEVAATGEYQGHRRLTLTYPCLRRARQLLWFVTGADKAAVVVRLQQNDQSIPAGRLGHDRNFLYTDRLAAPAVSENPVSPVLSIDVGGSHVKLMDSVHKERRKFDSSPGLTARQMCDGVLELAADWDYAAVSIGIPAPIRHNRPLANPPNLGAGWVEFDYSTAFGKPLKIINDAAMQALGSYQGGKTLFLGLGTGLGSAMVTRNLVTEMELAHLPYRKKKTFEDYVGERGLDRLGMDKWQKHVAKVVVLLQKALLPEDVILGGGNVRHFDVLPDGCRRGNNDDAFLGGFRLWEQEFICI
jgi:polyphosphate glucokinase